MKTPKKRGRPPIVTREHIVRITASMAKGTPKYYACAAAGIKEETFDTAVKSSEEYKEIRDRSHGVFIEDALTAIAVGSQQWQGKAWILERRYKPHFNRTDNQALTNPEGAALLTEADMLELERITKAEVRKGAKNA